MAKNRAKTTVHKLDDGRFLPPLADPVIADIFSSKEQAGLVMHALINDTLEDSGDSGIKEIIDLHPQKYIPHAKDHSWRIDVFAETKDGEIAITEVSLGKYKLVNDRSFIYAQQLIAQKMPRGTKWTTLPARLPKQVIMLNILDFEERITDQKDVTLDFHQVLELTYRQPPRQLGTKRFTVHNIELPKFRQIRPYLWKNLHCWLYMLHTAQDQRISLQEVVDKTPELASFAQRKGVRQFMSQYAISTASTKVRNSYYDWAQRAMFDAENDRIMVENAREEERAKAEKKENDVIINLLKMKTPVDIITTAFGYSTDRIKELEKYV